MINNNQTEQDNVSNSPNQEFSFAMPLLKFLYQIWWRVDTCGLEKLPDSGPALIVGNTSGPIPWPALMLLYGLMTNEKKRRTVHIVADIDHVNNDKLQEFLHALNFIPWSYDNAKRLIEEGQLVLVFPEDNSVIGKNIAARNRIERFDWTKFLPAIEAKVPIFPLATLGIDESNVVLHNSEFLSRLLEVKAFPVSPFFPWLPFPYSLATMPVSWKMQILPALNYNPAADRNAVQDEAKKLALKAEGEIQAQINRLLRARPSFF